jgi:hypothetical protein
MQIFPVSTRYDDARKKWQKVPAVPKGTHWAQYVPKPQEIESAKNVGAVIPAGKVVIDLDVYKGASREAVDSALGCSLDWEAAFLQTTVSGGEHYCFEIPEGVAIRQGTNLLGIQGLDTRCAGKGWICTGDGYNDQTFYGMPRALYELRFPMLPDAVCEMLSDGGGAKAATSAFDADLSLDLSALEQAVQERPDESVTIEIAREYLRKIPGARMGDYDDWLRVGMALHHQFKGDDDALALWIEASRRADNFDEKACRDRWRKSFKTSRDGGNVTTFASVKAMVASAGGMDVVKANLFESLVESAEKVSNLDEYEAFKKRVRKVSAADLPKDLRSMVGAALHSSFGKAAGLTKAEIRDQLAPAKVSGCSLVLSGAQGGAVPDWVRGWVYCEVPAEFANVELDYRIKRESFNAKYDREPECMNNPDPEAVPVHAAEFALNKVQIPTVVDAMFWPGAERIFTFEGRDMLNTYYNDGVDPVAPKDCTDEEFEAVNRFLQHIDLLVEDPQERGVILDWLSYVYQNPGKKMTWALLIQGAEGVGKSYFANMMQALLGRNMKTIDAMAVVNRFNAWAHGATLVAVEEIKISGENKYDIIDRLKPIISNPVVSIEEKGRDIRTVPNFSNYMMFTNHKDALPLSENDRRYAVIFTRFQSLEELNAHFGNNDAAQDYFDRLFKDLEEHAGAIAGFLSSYRQSSQFSPKGRAPLTSSKARMQRFSFSETDDFIDNAIGMDCPIFNARYIDATWLTETCLVEGVQVPSGRALGAALRCKGYEPIAARRVKISKGMRESTYHYIWAKPGQDERAIVDEVRQFFLSKAVTPQQPDEDVIF